MKVKCKRLKGFIIQGTGGWGIEPGEVKILTPVQAKDPRFAYYVSNGALEIVPEKTPLGGNSQSAPMKEAVSGKASESKEFQNNATGAVVSTVNGIVPMLPKKKTVEELADGTSDDEEAELKEAAAEAEGKKSKNVKGPEVPPKSKNRKK